MQEIVSVCVVAYNNARYIVETLESVKNQTYAAIDLVVSDDNSLDDTLGKVKGWVEENKRRFVSVSIIESGQNTGVSANCNRAVRKAVGAYVKLIGDDVLKPQYLERCVDFFHENPCAEVLCTAMDYFYSEGEFKFRQEDIDFSFFDLTAEEQYNRIVRFGMPRYPTPSVIYRKSVFEKVGYFDESIPLWEDGPMYFKLARNSIKIYCCPEALVDYRLLPESASNCPTKNARRNMSLYVLHYVFPNELMVNPVKAILRAAKHVLQYCFLTGVMILPGSRPKS